MTSEHRVQIEEDNAFGNLAVAIWKDVIAGHVLRELARTCWYFLKKRQQYDLRNHWTQKIVISRRQNLGCSCVYIFKACRQTQLFSMISSCLFQPVWTGFVAIFSMLITLCVWGGELMRGIKVPLQDFTLKCRGGFAQEGWRVEAYL